MKVKGKIQYSTAEKREHFARFLSTLVDGNGVSNYNFKPYKPNENDSFFWTIDTSNNWKVKFYEDEPNSFALIHRYQNNMSRFEESLFIWLNARMYDELIPDEPVKYFCALDTLKSRIQDKLT